MVRGVVAQRANCSLTPAPARDSLQFRIRQKPLERGVFTLEVFETLDVLPPDQLRPAPRCVAKVLVAKARPTIFTTTGFSYAAAETAIERPGPHRVPVAGRIDV